MDEDSITNIVSSSYATTEITESIPGLRIQNGGLQVDGNLNVGRNLNAGGIPIHNVVAYYTTGLSPGDITVSSLVNQSTYNTLDLTPKSLNSVLYISTSASFEKVSGSPTDSYITPYLNID